MTFVDDLGPKRCLKQRNKFLQYNKINKDFSSATMLIKFQTTVIIIHTMAVSMRFSGFFGSKSNLSAIVSRCSLAF